MSDHKLSDRGVIYGSQDLNPNQWAKVSQYVWCALKHG